MSEQFSKSTVINKLFLGEIVDTTDCGCVRLYPKDLSYSIFLEDIQYLGYTCVINVKLD